MSALGKALRRDRLRHLTAAMILEETHERARSVPSSYTLLKAEFGFTGTREEVMRNALAQSKEDGYGYVEDTLPL